MIEDETGWTYVSLVPLLDSLEGVDRIVWEDDSHATIYRTPISDSPTAQGTIFSLDILTCALIQISPPTPTSLPAHTSDSNLLFMDLIGGGGTGAGYGVGPIRGCLVRDNEVFVDQYALMKVAWHFDFEFDYLWEQKRMEITLHKDHLSGWEVTVDGKQVTVSVIEDETGWTYVSLVPLLDSLENVDRIVWENRAQAMIYRTPVSDSGFCAGKKFSLDIQRGELYQLIPLRDNWNILQIRVAGTTSHNVNGYIVRGNELFVDTHVLQMVGMSFDFKHEFLWEEQRLEITTPR
ncbi:MAG: hypothetical protein J6K62_07980 [Clostridia bacterium]|nr:hypothetical protein [Clostridia bacterium]